MPPKYHVSDEARGPVRYNADVKSEEYPPNRMWTVLVASLLVATGFWGWAERVLAPANLVTVQAAKRPIGNNSDLYPRWLGTRELLLHGRDPYSNEVTREIQTGFYGRPLDPHNSHDPVEKESFVYPLYVAFLLAPTARLPFPVVAEIFRWLLLGAIVLSVPLWMYAVCMWRALPIISAAMLLAVASYPSVEEYFQQNLTALVVFFLAAAAAAAVCNWLVLSGFLLAWSTCKPDITGLMVLWFLLWAAASWRQRSRVVYSFAATMTVLLAAAEKLSPHWIEQFAMAVRDYRSYGADPNIFGLLLPSWLAWTATVVLLLWLAVLCWHWRHAAAGSDEFALALALVGSVTLVVLPKAAAYNQLLLLPGLIVLWKHFGDIAQSGRLVRAMTKAAFACLGWTWVTAVGLGISSWAISASQLRTLALLPLYTLLALPPVTLLAIGLRAMFPQNAVRRSHV